MIELQFAMLGMEKCVEVQDYRSCDRDLPTETAIDGTVLSEPDAESVCAFYLGFICHMCWIVAVFKVGISASSKVYTM